MRPLDDNAGEAAGRSLAVLAETLFLTNLMLLPGIAFAVLAMLWLKHRHSAPPLARQHLRQATWVSLWGGFLIVALGGLILLVGGLGEAWTWVTLILYFTCIHSTLILFGMVALAKAIAGQRWRYPLIGPRLE